MYFGKTKKEERKKNQPIAYSFLSPACQSSQIFMKIILLCYMPSQSCFDAGLLENPHLMPLQSPSAYSYLRLNLLKRTKRILIPTALLSQGLSATGTAHSVISYSTLPKI